MRILQFLALCSQVSSVPCTNIPASPCPEVFRFKKEHHTTGVSGLLTVPGYRNGVNNTLDLVLSMPTFSYSTGSLDLLNIEDLPEKPAQFKIKLAPPLPHVVSIKLNGEVICRGPPARGLKVTTMKLQHFISLQSSDLDGDADYNDDFNNFDYIEEPPKSLKKPTTTTTTTTSKPYHHDDWGVSRPRYSQVCGQPAKPAVALMFHGIRTRKGEWPWLSAVYYKNKELGSLQFRCGATLVSGNALLTAAHCLLSANGNSHLQADSILVSLGRYNIMDWTELESKSINPRALVIHPGFRGDAFDYDIGLLILPNPVTYTISIRPICIWEEPSDESLIVGQSGTVVGWGFQESGVISDTPKSAQLPIVSEVDCIRSDIGFQLTTSKRTFCAGGEGTGPCQGDSGSGLYVRRDGRWVLRGIVSYALTDPDTGKCDTRKYAVYTDVAKYRDWLEEQDFQTP